MTGRGRERHLPGLDALRALAILLVIPTHARAYVTWPIVQLVGRNGWSGVELFFVLSGFLIAGQLLGERRRRGRVPFGRFYAKRAFRILPAYLVTLALYYVWPAFSEASQPVGPWRFPLFMMNFGAPSLTFSHAWSLCVEEHFYLVLPLLVALLAPRATARQVAALLAFVWVGGAALRYGLIAGGGDFWLDVYRPTWCRLDGLTVGVALALLQAERPRLWERLQRFAWPLVALGSIPLVLGFYAYKLGPAMASTWAFPAVAFGFAPWILAATAPSSWFARRRIPGAAGVAALAYTLYLTHKQMLHLAARLVGDPAAAQWTTAAVAGVCVVGCAVLLHVAVERPMLRLRDRLLARPASRRGSQREDGIGDLIESRLVRHDQYGQTSL